MKLQNPSLRKRKGFTLIELIVVIAILAILAAIAIPTFIGQLNRARVSTHNANVMSLRSAAAVAVAENGAPPAAGIAWDTVAFAADADATDPWDVHNYVDTWPSVPAGIGAITYTAGVANYEVSIIGEGVIDVIPGKVIADGSAFE